MQEKIEGGGVSTESAEATGWRPIDTAPKGPYILCVVLPDRAAVNLHAAIFGSAAETPNEIIIARRKAGDPKGKVRERNNGRIHNATHWMPFPTLPEDSE